MIEACLRNNRILSPSSPRTSSCCRADSVTLSRSAARSRLVPADQQAPGDRPLEDALSDVASPADLATIDHEDEVQDLLGDDARPSDTCRLPRRPADPRGRAHGVSHTAPRRESADLTTCSRGSSATVATECGARRRTRREATKPYEFGDPLFAMLDGGWTRFTAGRACRHGQCARGAPRTVPDFGPPDGPLDPDLHGPAGGHEWSMLRQLAGRQEGRGRARHHPDAVPARPAVCIGFAYYAREIRPGALAELTATNTARTSAAGLLLAHRILERTPGEGDRGHHGRPWTATSRTARSSSTTRRRDGRSRTPPRGATLHEGDHDATCRTVGTRRVRRPHDAAQPGACLLRHPGAPRRVHCPRSICREPADQRKGLLTSPARPGWRTERLLPS